MIKVDISNVWGQLSLPDLLAVEHEIAAAHNTLAQGTGEGNDFLGWLNLPVTEPTEEMVRIMDAAKKIRNDSDVLVVIGIGGSYLGPRAAIELLQGPNHNIGKGKGDPQIFFAGNGLSTRHWNELMRLLEGKDFSVIVISKSGTTTEPAIATRALRWMLERKYGTEGAAERIYAITDPIKGALRQMAQEEGWETFVIPPDVGGPGVTVIPGGSSENPDEWKDCPDGVYIKEVKGATFNAYVMVTRDPSKVYMATSSTPFSKDKPGLRINEAIAKEGAIAAINAGAFCMIAGLILVPAVSLFTKPLPASHTEQVFSCYDKIVVVSAKEAIGDPVQEED